MKIAQINVVYGVGSTGKIILSIENHLDKEDKSICYYGREGISGGVKIASKFSIYFHALMSMVFGRHGLYSWRSTKKLIKALNSFNPDIIHLHNIHGYYLNYKMLFKYLQKINKPVVWTLHDEWVLTGHCACFNEELCNGFETGCKKCKYKNEYPKSIFDNSNKNYLLKQKLFTSLNDITFVTPSLWLKGYIDRFLLKQDKTIVINNGIDLDTFKQCNSNFRQVNNLQDKKILLGVSWQWNDNKGLQFFNKLAEELPNEYKIVLVGTQAREDINKNILCIERTSSKQELAEIYSTSNLFINPTLLENFPTVNIEALACGLPVVTFKTGGSAEIIDKSCGIAIEKGNYEQLKSAILSYDVFSSENCRKRAENFSELNMVEKYINLYKSKL